MTNQERNADWTMQCPHCDHVAKGFRDARSKEENPHWQLTWHVNAAHQDKLFLCPRRCEGGYAMHENERDFWSMDRGHRHCSYCGSAHPDDVIAGVEAGTVELGPTDKSYKSYLTGGTFKHAKFYFQHLSPEQMDRFIELHNSNKMKVGYPGRFYVKPFFCQYVDKR